MCVCVCVCVCVCHVHVILLAYDCVTVCEVCCHESLNRFFVVSLFPFSVAELNDLDIESQSHNYLPSLGLVLPEVSKGALGTTEEPICPSYTCIFTTNLFLSLSFFLSLSVCLPACLSLFLSFSLCLCLSLSFCLSLSLPPSLSLSLSFSCLLSLSLTLQLRRLENEIIEEHNQLRWVDALPAVVGQS